MTFKNIFAPARSGEDMPSACEHSHKVLFGLLALTFAPMLLAHVFCMSQEAEAAAAPTAVEQSAAAR
ncbi:hypothetical protein [Hansschlegelia zhihuaiae]|uniref:Uncharacterized protein n=1 Tax=Hansschlegelia zhihuaiae TaxID=405005 RepID=A0A4Q0MC96_9HYPH|nr:hypothetical protein [Hansschlegelia zhihuaiae]RXF70815.1 hypothetical protein EK403_16725 [Hansschlegelia zhihuaiae]